MVHPVHLLIVEDHQRLARSLRTAFQVKVESLTVAPTAAAAIQALGVRRPDWMLLDLFLPDGSGMTVLEAANRLSPMPRTVVLSSSRDPREAFALARLGVWAYLEKPGALAAIERSFLEPPEMNLAAQVRPLVGHRSLESIEDEVRGTLVDEAMACAAGSKSHAARLLSVSRQLLQYILRTRRH